MGKRNKFICHICYTRFNNFKLLHWSIKTAYIAIEATNMFINILILFNLAQKLMFLLCKKFNLLLPWLFH